MDNPRNMTAMELKILLAIILGFVPDLALTFVMAYYIPWPIIFWGLLVGYVFIFGLKSPTKPVVSALSRVFHELGYYSWRMYQVVHNTYRSYYPQSPEENVEDLRTPNVAASSQLPVQETAKVSGLEQGETSNNGSSSSATKDTPKPSEEQVNENESLSERFRRFHESVRANTPAENEEGRRLRKQRLASAKNPFIPLHYNEYHSSTSSLSDRIAQLHSSIDNRKPLSRTLDPPAQARSEKTNSVESLQQHNSTRPEIESKPYSLYQVLHKPAQKIPGPFDSSGKFTVPSDTSSSSTDIYGYSDDDQATGSTPPTFDDAASSERLSVKPTMKDWGAQTDPITTIRDWAIQTNPVILTCSVPGCPGKMILQPQASSSAEETGQQAVPMDVDEVVEELPYELPVDHPDEVPNELPQIAELGGLFANLSVDVSHEMDYEDGQPTPVPQSSGGGMNNREQSVDLIEFEENEVSALVFDPVTPAAYSSHGIDDERSLTNAAIPSLLDMDIDRAPNEELNNNVNELGDRMADLSVHREPMDVVDELEELTGGFTSLSVDNSHEMEAEPTQTLIIPQSTEVDMDSPKKDSSQEDEYSLSEDEYSPSEDEFSSDSESTVTPTLRSRRRENDRESEAGTGYEGGDEDTDVTQDTESTDEGERQVRPQTRNGRRQSERRRQNQGRREDEDSDDSRQAGRAQGSGSKCGQGNRRRTD